MTDLDVAPTAAGWYPDPEGVAANRFWDGSAWTIHTKGGPARFAPPTAANAVQPGHIAPMVDVPRNGMATAGLVLGIVSLLLDVLWIPTILAIVFGSIGISRAGARGGVGRARAIVAIVLGVLAIPVQAAIAIPVYLAVQDHARLALINSEIENRALNSGVRLEDLACPTAPRPEPGDRFTCTATTSSGQHLLLDVVLGPDNRVAQVSARRG